LLNIHDPLPNPNSIHKSGYVAMMRQTPLFVSCWRQLTAKQQYTRQDQQDNANPGNFIHYDQYLSYTVVPPEYSSHEQSFPGRYYATRWYHCLLLTS